MRVVPAGITIFFKLLHLLNTNVSISLRFTGKSTFISDEHPPNIPEGNFSIESGKTTVVNALAPANIVFACSSLAYSIL